MHFQQQEGLQIVKVDTGAESLRSMLRISIIVFIALLVGAILIALMAPNISGINLRPEFSYIYPFIFPVYIAFCFALLRVSIGPFITLRKQLPLRKQHEHRRQAAVRGEYRILSKEQPIPNASTLSLPFTIRQRPNWYIPLLYLVIAILAIVFCFLSLAFHLFSSTNYYSGLAYLVIAIPTACWAIGFELWKFYSHRGIQIIVADDGLFVPISRSKFQHIAWCDARLFAINHVFSSSQYPGCLQFELSSANTIIRWIWLRPDIYRLRQSARPVVSRTEYDWQMHALLSHIAARTQLPLYDLRMEQPSSIFEYRRRESSSCKKAGTWREKVVKDL